MNIFDPTWENIRFAKEIIKIFEESRTETVVLNSKSRKQFITKIMDKVKIRRNFG